MEDKQLLARGIVTDQVKFFRNKCLAILHVILRTHRQTYDQSSVVTLVTHVVLWPGCQLGGDP